MSRMNLSASAGDITLALVLRGLGLAIITVPLTALAVSSVDAKDVPQGAALNNMMRQLGGSVGLAVVNTYLANRNALHRSNLVSNITSDNPAAGQRLLSYTKYFLTKGFTAFDAKAKALQLLDMNIVRQSSALSFADAYLLVGAIFVFALPMLLYAKQWKKGVNVAVILSDH